MKAYREEIIVLKKLARDNLMYGGANASGVGGGESEGKDAGAANTEKVLNELIALKEKNEGLVEEVKTARKENQSLRGRIEELQRELENERVMGDRVRMSKELFKNKLEEMQLKYGKEAVTIPEEQHPQQQPQQQQQETTQHRTPKPLPQIPQQPQQTTPPSTPGVSFEKEDSDQTRGGSSSVKQEEFYVGYVVTILAVDSSLLIFILFLNLVMGLRKSIDRLFMELSMSPVCCYSIASTNSAKLSNRIPTEDNSRTC